MGHFCKKTAIGRNALSIRVFAVFSEFMEATDPLRDLKIQSSEDGCGCLYHRTYTARLTVENSSAAELMALIQSDINRFSPQIMARFEKTRGEEGSLRAGDHFLIHIAGPWNGPVRVSEVKKDSFTLATLEGHPEAGMIKFSVCSLDGKDQFLFRIESWARSRDTIVDILYDKLPIMRAAQTEMWDRYCQSLAEFVQKDPEVRVTMKTEKYDGETKEWVPV